MQETKEKVKSNVLHNISNEEQVKSLKIKGWDLMSHLKKIALQGKEIQDDLAKKQEETRKEYQDKLDALQKESNQINLAVTKIENQLEIFLDN